MTAIRANPFRQLGLALILVLACPAAAIAQDQEPEQPVGDGISQMLIDIEALIVATDMTVQCAVIDDSIDYLTPVELVGARVRLDEMVAELEGAVEASADRIARARADAPNLECGSEEAVPYLDFARQVARDVIDIALTAWQEIAIESCNYFADDDFLAATERAQAVAQETTIEGADNRVRYVEQQAAAWVTVFDDNCRNLYFDPVDTLPGKIALALPSQ